MNENLNLVEILKDCPKGANLYSPLFGEVNLDYIDFDDKEFPIAVKCKFGHHYFTQTGRYNSRKEQECLLFPSKDQRDWSKFKVKKPKFDPKTLQPFDKVLARDVNDREWTALLFSHISAKGNIIVAGSLWSRVIPYNEETKHLLGTNKEAPEFYRYWEE